MALEAQVRVWLLARGRDAHWHDNRSGLWRIFEEYLDEMPGAEAGESVGGLELQLGRQSPVWNGWLVRCRRSVLGLPEAWAGAVPVWFGARPSRWN